MNPDLEAIGVDNSRVISFIPEFYIENQQLVIHSPKLKCKVYDLSYLAPYLHGIL